MLQDFKLSTLRWHLLPGLGGLLAELAGQLGAHAYVDHYMRDLGPDIAPGRAGPALSASASSGALACRPTCAWKLSPDNPS